MSLCSIHSNHYHEGVVPALFINFLTRGREFKQQKEEKQEDEDELP
jgi:hypothetical protein